MVNIRCDEELGIIEIKYAPYLEPWYYFAGTICTLHYSCKHSQHEEVLYRKGIQEETCRRIPSQGTDRVCLWHHHKLCQVGQKLEFYRAPDKDRFLLPRIAISSPNPMFDHLLESSHREDSNKWSNIGFCEKIRQIELKLTLSLLAVNFEVNFEDHWWPLQTIWIQMKPHNMWASSEIQIIWYSDYIYA